jgi:polygalacturonase
MIALNDNEIGGHPAAGGFWNVLEHGAAGDGETLDTGALQRAIAACGAAGGGYVLFPPGVYLSGTLRFLDGVHLFLPPGAVIVGSPDPADYAPQEELRYETFSDEETSYFNHALLLGRDCTDVGVEGGGVVDGGRFSRRGPKPLSLVGCSNVRVRDITLQNAANYTISLLDCEYVTVDNATLLNTFADGIDLDNVRFARVSNSYFDCWDDAVCLKTSYARGSLGMCSDIAVTNCHISSGCQAVKVGTETHGDVRNLVVSNCTIFKRPISRSTLAAIALEAVDGCALTNVAISNVTISGCLCPILIRLGNRARGNVPPRVGTISDVTISNVTARGAHWPSLIAGLPHHPVSNVFLSNLITEYSYPESEIPPDAGSLDIPEAEAEYPDPRMFGVPPAWALYCRHVRGFQLSQYQFRLTSQDPRAALVLDDVEDAIIGPGRIAGPNPVARLRNLRDVTFNAVNGPFSPESDISREGGQFRNVTFD